MASNGTEVARAVVTIVPSMAGAQKTITKELAGVDASASGKSVGASFASGIAKGVGAATAVVGAASAAMVGFGKSAVEAGSAFDTSMAQVAATMGVAVEDIGELRDFAQQMGSTTAFSASQAAEALNYMALAGYDAEKSMSMLPSVLDLAAAGGMDLAYASDMVTDASSALGLTTEQTAAMVDQMAKASSKSNTSVSQLGEAMLVIGATARNVAGGTEELSTMLGVLADNGIKGAEGGTHLRNILLALNPTSQTAAGAWERLGVAAYDAQGNMRALPDIMADLNAALDGMSMEERTNMLGMMFNKTDLAAVNALLGTSAERFDELNTAISGAWFTADSLTESLSTFGADFSVIQKNMEKLGISADTFGDVLQQSGGDAEMFRDMLLEAADAGVSEKDIMDGLGLSLTDLQAAFEGASGAASAMAETQLDNLQGDITLFKSALEGVQIAISDQLTPALRGFVQLGSEALSGITAAFNEGGFEAAFASLGEYLGQGLAMITENLPDLSGAAIDLLGSFGSALLDNLDVLVDSAVEIVGQLGQFILDALPQLIEAALQVIVTLANGITESIPQMIPQIINVVIQICNTLIQNLPLLITAAIQLFLGIIQGLLQALPQIIASLPLMIDSIINALIDSIPLLVECGVKLFIALIQNLPAIIVALVGAVVKIVADIVAKFLSFAGDLIDTGWDLMMDLKDGILNAIGGVLDAAAEIGSNIIDGIWNGIKAGWDWLCDTVSDLATGLFDAAKDALDIASPSKKFKWLGEMCVEGFDKGIEGLMDSTGITKDINASLNIAATGTGAYSGSFGAGAESFAGIGGGFTQNLYITSPKALTPSEVARQTRNATRQMVLALQGV